MIFNAAVSSMLSDSFITTELDKIGLVELQDIRGSVVNPVYQVKVLKTGEIRNLSDEVDPLHILLDISVPYLCPFLKKELYMGTICDGGLILCSLVFDKLVSATQQGEEIVLKGEIEQRFVYADEVVSRLDKKDIEDYKIIIPFTKYMELFHYV